ncbi:MAG: hypothetical protein D6736_18990 [Nitrospinota bacterium]|nr:MAG: hypothetical protein D6736_18990 [Nitrospinota bacterium]
MRTVQGMDETSVQFGEPLTAPVSNSAFRRPQGHQTPTSRDLRKKSRNGVCEAEAARDGDGDRGRPKLKYLLSIL